MEKSKKTARANPEPPDLTQPVNILEKLLDIELKRLDIAVRIENERNIVFPETTVIIHDIMKIEKAIKDKTSEQKQGNKKEIKVLPREKRSYRGTVKDII